jgi:hypothetical protein
VLLSEMAPQARLGTRVRVRLQNGGVCEELLAARGFAHDPSEDGQTGTLRRCESRPGEPSHH